MRRLVRTDYRFASRAEALDTLLFFFGKGVAARATTLLADEPPDAPCIVPECTLFCWRHKPPEAQPAAAKAAGLARRIHGWLSGRRATARLCAYLAVGALATSVLISRRRR